eukprot:COSAG05_NODE_4120_length_1664_cov_2.200000_2_plen_113_part_00
MSSGDLHKYKYEGVLYNTASFGTDGDAPFARYSTTRPPPPVTHKSSSELFITTRPSLYGDDGDLHLLKAPSIIIKHQAMIISTGVCRVGYGRAVDSAVKQRSVLAGGLLPAR